MALIAAARPPTPPKATENVDKDIADALEFLETDFSTALPQSQLTRGQTLQTPPTSSPLSFQDRKFTTKKVCFSPWPDFHRPPDYAAQDCGLSPLKQLLPSRQLKPIRSILKQSPESPIPPSPGSVQSSASPLAGRISQNFETILDHTLNQLEHGDEKARTDAYISLCGTLGACECVTNGPGIGVLRERVDKLTAYIKRDCVFAPNEKSTPGIGLITQSLKLLSILLFTRPFSLNIRDDVRTFIVERSLEVVQYQNAPKAIVRHCLLILSQQNFTSKIVTQARATRLLDILYDIEERIKGNSVVGGRLSIYQRLMTQTPLVFLSRIKGVLEHVFHGMLSSIGDIRKRAIDLGSQIGVNLGKNSQCLKALTELFDARIEADASTCFGSLYANRLLKMVNTQEQREHVPQIWAVAILFFQNRGHKLPAWQHTPSWLRVITRCLNCGDGNVRFQAYFAWNRLVSVIRPNASTSKDMVSMLIQPLSLQLQRPGKSKASRQIKLHALFSYCNLLYYSLRPFASHDELDTFWCAYVQSPLSELLHQGSEYTDRANQILMAFFGGFCQISWNEDRAHNPKQVKPCELARLNVKWIRSRLSIILPALEESLAIDLQMVAEVEKTHSIDVWSCLMSSVAEAGNQEVKTSPELREAVAQIVNSLHRLWNRIVSPCDQEHSPNEDFATSFLSIIYAPMHAIGSYHFTQKILVQRRDSTYKVAPSPSSRSGRVTERMTSPFLCLFRLVASSCSSGSFRRSACSQLSNLIGLACASQNTRQAKLNLLQDCIDVAVEGGTQGDSAAVECIWPAIADATTVAFDYHQFNRSESEPHLGREFQTAINILRCAISSNQEPFNKCLHLFKSLSKAAQREAGDGGAALAVSIPLANIVNNCWANMKADLVLFWASLILEHGPNPQDKQSLESGQRILWNSPLDYHSNQTSQPHEEVYSLAEKSLQLCLRPDRSLYLRDIIRFLSSLAAFIDSTQTALVAAAIQGIQNGVAYLLEQSSIHDIGADGILRPMIRLWKSINNALRSLPCHEESLLEQLAPMISAGFRCRHKDVVIMLRETWSQTFGKAEKMAYPKSVELARQQSLLPTIADLPVHSQGDNDKVTAAQQMGVECTNVFEEVAHKDCPPVSNPLKTYPKSPSSPPLKPASNEEQAPTPEARRIASPERPTPKARLRHDDSQIEFTVIESSPTDYNAMESQLLTEHQKEVRSQQQAEVAAMFPDIQSSSEPRNTDNLQRQRNALAISSIKTDVERPVTPTSPGPECVDDFLNSSPTPGSSAKRDLIMLNDVCSDMGQVDGSSEEQSRNDDVPSSPPDCPKDSEAQSSKPTSIAPIDCSHLSRDGDMDAGTGAVPHIDVRNRGLVQESPTPFSGSQITKNDLDFTHAAISSHNAMDRQMTENEHNEENVQFNEKETTPSRIVPSMPKGRENDMDTARKTVEISELQFTTGVRSTKSRKSTNVPALPFEQSSDQTERQTILVQASQSSSELPTGNTDADPLITAKMQTQASLENYDGHDNSLDSQSAVVEDSFVQDGYQLFPEDEDEPTRKTSKRKRASQETIKTRRPVKKQFFKPLQLVEAGAFISGEADDIQDCITVLPFTSLASQPSQSSDMSMKRKPGRPRKSGPAFVELMDRSLQRKRKASLELMQDDTIAKRGRSGEDNATLIDPETSDQQSEDDVTETGPRPGSRTLSHVEIKAGQHPREMSLDLEDDIVNESLDSQSIAGQHADDTHEERVLVGATEEDVDETGRTTSRVDADDAEASQQLLTEQAAAQTAQRRIAQPKSIIERLKGILAECKEAVFGSQERLEMYDTLADLQSEVRKQTADGGM